jgi:hypothetical protein
MAYDAMSVDIQGEQWTSEGQPIEQHEVEQFLSAGNEVTFTNLDTGEQSLAYGQPENQAFYAQPLPVTEGDQAEEFSANDQFGATRAILRAIELISGNQTGAGAPSGDAQAPDQPEEEMPMESTTPDQIADLISEDLKPGRRGLVQEDSVEEALTVEPTINEEQTISDLADNANEDDRLIAELATPGAAAAPAAPGQMADKDGKPIDIKSSLETIVNTSGHLLQHAKKAAAASEGGDVQQARFHFAQMLGAAQLGYKTADTVCTAYGLPPLATG